MSQLLVKKYRSTPELYFEILSNIDYNGSKCTKIMFLSRQQFGHTKKKLASMIRMGMITYNAETRLYHRTIKGDQYMKIYQMLKVNLQEIDDL